MSLLISQATPLRVDFYQNKEFRNFECKFLDQEQCYEV